MKTKKLKPERSKHTLFQFVDVVPWKNIEQRMNKREFKKFVDFMDGQTCMLDHDEPMVYVGDLSRFLSNINDRTLYD